MDTLHLEQVEVTLYKRLNGITVDFFNKFKIVFINTIAAIIIIFHLRTNCNLSMPNKKVNTYIK